MKLEKTFKDIFLILFHLSDFYNLFQYMPAIVVDGNTKTNFLGALSSHVHYFEQTISPFVKCGNVIKMYIPFYLGCIPNKTNLLFF